MLALSDLGERGRVGVMEGLQGKYKKRKKWSKRATFEEMEWRSVTRVWSYTITEKKDIVLFMWGFVKCNECKTHHAHRCICMCATVIFLFLFFCLLCSSLFPSVIMGQASILAGLLKRGLLHFVSRKKTLLHFEREREDARSSVSEQGGARSCIFFFFPGQTTSSSLSEDPKCRRSARRSREKRLPSNIAAARRSATSHSQAAT